MDERNKDGTLKPGHKGLKPKGANNRLQGEIREKITGFLEGKLESLDVIYSEVSAKDKLKFLSELLPYVIPRLKQMDISIEPSQTDQDILRTEIGRNFERLFGQVDIEEFSDQTRTEILNKLKDDN